LCFKLTHNPYIFVNGLTHFELLNQLFFFPTNGTIKMETIFFIKDVITSENRHLYIFWKVGIHRILRSCFQCEEFKFDSRVFIQIVL